MSNGKNTVVVSAKGHRCPNARIEFSVSNTRRFKDGSFVIALNRDEALAYSRALSQIMRVMENLDCVCEVEVFDFRVTAVDPVLDDWCLNEIEYLAGIDDDSIEVVIICHAASGGTTTMRRIRDRANPGHMQWQFVGTAKCEVIDCSGELTDDDESQRCDVCGTEDDDEAKDG